MNNIKEIAQRLREIRDLSDVTVEELCEKLTIPMEQYLEIESGNVDIPISVLCEAAEYYGISVTELLTGEQAKLSLYSLVRKDKGIGVERTRDYNYKNLAYDFASRKIEPLLVTIGKKPKEALHMNAHKGHEFHYCLEGGFIFYIDNHEIEVREGDSLYFDSEHPHAMSSIGEQAKILVIVI
ncbi:MAG: cupin domain-containing protein [Clostridia bacterium]|nr:helix-turn-helix transcriptional regulator [Oscillospiraceae bacterium]MBQ4623906.1 cupin domain-containing protein [Clostridia bacterium]MBR6763615.1 cupin domain-containing protein [Clostridia bacterium]